jgi:hypothetical protein
MEIMQPMVVVNMRILASARVGLAAEEVEAGVLATEALSTVG